MEPADGHDTSKQFNPFVHSTHGINSVSLAGFPHPIDSRIIRTTEELPEEFPFNLDMNSGNHIGVGMSFHHYTSNRIVTVNAEGWIQATINGGRRSSSATSYLGPNFIARPNLHVLINARITRLLQTGGTSRAGDPFNIVEFFQNSTGTCSTGAL